MIELKTRYPYVDSRGIERLDLIEHYAEDENGTRYYVLQHETGDEYVSAIDVFPCKYTYSKTNKIVEEIIDGES